MKKNLLTAVVLLGLSAMNVHAEKDPATYPDASINGGEKTVTFNSEWIYSMNLGNYKAENHPFQGNVGGARTMTLANGKLYVGERVTVGTGFDLMLHVISGEDGKLIESKKISEGNNLFKKSDGDWAPYPLNSLRTDSKGNLVMMNMVLNIQKYVFQVWAMADENAEPKLILDNVPYDMGLPSMRIDFASVYGDVFGDGYIAAAVAGADVVVSKFVYIWKIEGGVVAQSPEMIDIQDFSPAAYEGKPIVTLGGAPAVFPVSDKLFYLDGHSTRPTKYDMEGNIVDQFENTPEGTPYPSTGANGVVEFTLAGEKYLAVGGTNSDKSGDILPHSFMLYKMGTGGRFDGMEHLYTFPSAGLGATKNESYVTLPFFEAIDENSGNLYVFALGNGFAKYKVTVESGQSINKQLNDAAVYVKYTNGQFVVNASAVSVEIFTIDGAKVAEAQNTSAIDANVAHGVYIARVKTASGNLHTQKVLVQ